MSVSLSGLAEISGAELNVNDFVGGRFFLLNCNCSQQIRERKEPMLVSISNYYHKRRQNTLKILAKEKLELNTRNNHRLK